MTNRKHLDRWARDAGFSDFDTYVRAGGSILDARRDIAGRIANLQSAMTACNDERLPDFPQQPEPPPITVTSDVPDAEPPDPHNAHPQGDDA